MISQPLISVVTRAYNEENYILNWDVRSIRSTGSCAPSPTEPKPRRAGDYMARLSAWPRSKGWPKCIAAGTVCRTPR
jgi:hypothetical protein